MLHSTHEPAPEVGEEGPACHPGEVRRHESMVIKELIGHVVLFSLPLWLLIEQLLSLSRRVDDEQDPTLLNAIPRPLEQPREILR